MDTQGKINGGLRGGEIPRPLGEDKRIYEGILSILAGEAESLNPGLSKATEAVKYSPIKGHSAVYRPENKPRFLVSDMLGVHFVIFVFQIVS